MNERKDHESGLPIPVRGETPAGAGPEPPAEESAPPSPEGAPAAAPQPGEEVRRLQAELESLRDSLARRQADFENARRRLERERRAEAQRTTLRLARELLPVLDSFDRALAAVPGDGQSAGAEFRKGFELIERQLREVLGRLGLEPIEAEGQPFDPRIHEAIERVESADHDDGVVLAELQRGYRLGGEVVRPALVRVATHPDHAPAAPEEKR